MKDFIKFILLLFCTSLNAQNNKFLLNYNIETFEVASKAGQVPFWFTANKFGITGVKHNQLSLRTQLNGYKEFKRNGKFKIGVEVVAGTNKPSDIWLHQAYIELFWKHLGLSIGSKERLDMPLYKNTSLTSGWMVEGINVRPIPQIRLGISEYVPISILKNWVSIKGHIAYGWFTDDNWQKSFIGKNQRYIQNVLYHSKSLMIRLGNQNKIPLNFEFGLHMAGQFGGNIYEKDAEGNSNFVVALPKGPKAYWKAFYPSPGDQNSLYGEQLNIEGNIVGSWNFALDWHYNQWKTRIYLEHYFEDSSQIFWEYGPWKDGQLGIEISFPKNRFFSVILWEGMNTKDQTSSVFVRDQKGPFNDISMRGNDNYYNNYLYQAWQSYGFGIGHPLIPGPIYINDGGLHFRSNRVSTHHIGIQGCPSDQFNWKILASHAKHLGTYSNPLDKKAKQSSFLFEFNYIPSWTKGWKLGFSMGVDRGNYLGDSVGVMLTLSKKGHFNL